MYFSDETLQEIGFYYAMTDPPEEEPVAEADYDEQERQEERRQADCWHLNTSEEPCGQVLGSGAVELYLVCHDCGATKPLGVYTSIL